MRKRKLIGFISYEFILNNYSLHDLDFSTFKILHTDNLKYLLTIRSKIRA